MKKVWRKVIKKSSGKDYSVLSLNRREFIFISLVVLFVSIFANVVLWSEYEKNIMASPRISGATRVGGVSSVSATPRYCNDGNLDFGEECEVCEGDSDCNSGVCTDAGVCVIESYTDVNPCNLENPNQGRFKKPSGITVDSYGNLFVTDLIDNYFNTGMIKKVYMPSGAVGNVEAGTNNYIYNPSDLAASLMNHLYYVSDSVSVNMILDMNLNLDSDSPDFISRLVGGSIGGTTCYGNFKNTDVYCRNGVDQEARFYKPNGLALDIGHQYLYVADGEENARVRQINLATKEVKTIAGGADGLGTMTGASIEFGNVEGITTGILGDVYVVDSWKKRIVRLYPNGGNNPIEEKNWNYEYIAGKINGGTPTDSCANSDGDLALFSNPVDVEYDFVRNVLYVSDEGSHTICTVDLKNPNHPVSLLAGTPSLFGGFSDGTLSEALFKNPMKIEFKHDDYLYISDLGNLVIREIDLGTNTVSTVAGEVGVSGEEDDSVIPVYDCVRCSCEDGSGSCGNGVCEPEFGENIDNCMEDCNNEYCGDGVCNSNENYYNCPVDCTQLFNPGIAYVESFMSGLWFISCNDKKCLTTETHDEKDQDHIGKMSMTRNFNGNPIIVYYDNDTSDLKTYSCSSIDCDHLSEGVESVVYSSNNQEIVPSIKIMSNGYPIIAIAESRPGGEVKFGFIKCYDFDCTQVSLPYYIDSHNAGVYYISLEIGSDGYPIMAYSANNVLNVVHCKSLNCDSSSGFDLNQVTQTPSGIPINNVEMGIVGDENPLIAYTNDNTTNGLTTLHCSDNACSNINAEGIFDQGIYISDGLSMDVTSSGKAKITYDSAYGLKIIECINNQCDLGITIDTNIQNYYVHSLDLMSLGFDEYLIIYSNYYDYNIYSMYCQSGICDSPINHFSYMGASDYTSIV